MWPLLPGSFRPALTAPQAGDAIAQLISDPGFDQAAYLLTAAGLTPLS